jgi:hypothetical protein
VDCILFNPYLILNIAQTSISVFHILWIFFQMKILKIELHFANDLLEFFSNEK